MRTRGCEKSSQSTESTKEYKYTCPICLQPFSSAQRLPVSLNCGHTFCAICVDHLQTSSYGAQGEGVGVRYKLGCGICRAITYAPPQVMKKNVLMMELLDQQGELAESDILDDEEDLLPEDNEVEEANENEELGVLIELEDEDEEFDFNWFLLIDHNHHIERIEENIRVIREIQGLTNFTSSLLHRYLRGHRREFERLEREWDRLANRFTNLRQELDDIAEQVQSLYEAAFLSGNGNTPANNSSRQRRAHD